MRRPRQSMPIMGIDEIQSLMHRHRSENARKCSNFDAEIYCQNCRWSNLIRRGADEHTLREVEEEAGRPLVRVRVLRSFGSS